MTESFAIISSETLNKYFWPVLLHMIVPFLVVGLIFLILRMVCARLLRGARYLRVLVDGVLVLLFLLVAGIMVPIVFNTLQLPSAESNESVISDINSAYEKTVDAIDSAMAKNSSSASD